MQTIVTDDHSVCQSVCCAAQLSLTVQKTAEQIEILLGVNTFGGPSNIVLDVCPDPPTARGGVRKNFIHCGPTTYLKLET